MSNVTCPELIIPESKKTDKWCKDFLSFFSETVASNSNTETDIECWKLYHNEVDPREMDYLTTVGEYSMPAQPRHIPLQRHYCDILISKQSKRPWVFSVNTVDKNSLKEKAKAKTDDFFNMMMETTKQIVYDKQSQIEMIDYQIQQLQSFISKEPTSEEELAQINQAKAMMPAMTSKFTYAKDMMLTSKEIFEQKAEAWDRYHRYKKKDWIEEISQKVTINLRNKLNIANKSKRNFISQVVTGKQAYKVDIEGQKLIFEPINELNVFYPSIDNVQFIQDCPWVVIRRQMSFVDIIARWGGEIKANYGEERIKQLEQYVSRSKDSNSQFVATPNGGMLVSDIYSGTVDNSINTTVEEIYWKVPRLVKIKKTPNKKEPGEYFRHFISNEKKVIDSSEYTYAGKEYISKKDPNIKLSRENTEIYDSSKGEKYDEKYDCDIYMGYVIDGDIFVEYGVKKQFYNDIDNIADKKLPVVGRCYNNITERPYSIIWNTRDIQKLYNIVHYHRELMLALSGTKGQVMDYSQKPSHLTDDEWEYKKKLGNIIIETVDKTGRVKNISYNQWQSFDNTLSPAIQYLDNVLVSLENTMGSITGITRQALGEVVPSDQVATFRQSIAQSQLITEIIFSDHDEVEKMALTQLLNLALKYRNDDDLILEIEDLDLSKEIITIPKNLFKDRQFEVVIMDNTKDGQKMEDLREFAKAEMSRGILSFSQLFSIFNTESTKELEKKIEYFTEKQEKLAKLNAGSEIDAEKQIIQFTKEFDMQIAALPLKYKEAELQLQKAAIDLDEQRLALETKYNEQKLNNEYEIKNKDLEYRRESELSLLNVNDKHSTTNEQIQALQLKIDALFREAELGQSKEDSDKKFVSDIKKIEATKKKQNMEHVKN